MIGAAVLLAVTSVLWLRDAGRFGQQTDDLKHQAEVAGATVGMSAGAVHSARLELDSLQSKLADAETTLTDTQSELSGLQADLSAADAAVRPMATALLAVESDLVGLAGRFDDTAGALNAITASYDSAIGKGNMRDIETMKSAFESVRTAVADLATGVDRTTTQLASLRAELDALRTTAPEGSHS